MTNQNANATSSRAVRQGLRSLCALLVVCLSLASLPAQAQGNANYPNKPIRLLVPLAAGSAVDNAARILAAKMSAGMGQNIVVENLPGASGLIGAEKVARAAPDGYTLGGFNDSIMTMVPNLQPKMPWDIFKDFEPVSLVATIEWGLVAGNDGPLRSAADLIALARAEPARITYGSGGNGSPQHLAMAMFAHAANLNLVHVPYKGATQAAVGVAGGEVTAAFQGLATVTSLIQGGKLKLIGVTTPKRMAAYPNVPTVAESGLPGFEFNSWFTLMAPAGTPPDIVERLNAQVRAALADPEVRLKFDQQGLTPRGSSADELRRATRDQFDRYAKVIRSAGIKAE
jgi:tripartite-type tricarboxylate transporter receptor subunit TctC